MGDTIKEFILFVTNNPLMLGLCIAIVVLFIILIIVLFSGRKTTKVIEEKTDTNTSGTKDNLEQPLVEQTSLESDMTSPEIKAPEVNSFTANNIQSTFDEINKENAEAEGPALFTEEEAPINISEALNLKDKINSENSGVDELADKTIPTAAIPIPVELKKASVTEEKVEFPKPEHQPISPVSPATPVVPPVSQDITEDKANNDFDSLIKEINTMKTGPINVQDIEGSTEEKDINFQNAFPKDDLDKTIVATDNGEVNLNKLFEDDSFLSSGNNRESTSTTLDVPQSPVAPNTTAPLSSVNLNNTNTNIFDQQIEKKPEVPVEDEEVNLDDIELPKFKDESSDVLDNLKGESFDI